MDSPMPDAAPVPAHAEPGLSPLQRAVAVFTRPASAWGGLEARAQWWFPMLVLLVVSLAFSAALHQRAMVPMMVDSWEEAVADGRMTAVQVDRMESFMSGPTGLAITMVQQLIALPVILLFTALLVWFGAGFILGTRFRFRLALEAAAWSSLVTIPGQLLTGALAWGRQTMKGIHTGFGILVPEADPPGKLQAALGFFLDAIGPLSIWYLAVLVLGVAALSGARRKPVAWVLGGLYAVLMGCFAGLVAMMTRGG